MFCRNIYIIRTHTNIMTIMMIQSYRARCCGTCKNSCYSNYNENRICALDESEHNMFCICASDYEPKEH